MLESIKNNFTQWQDKPNENQVTIFAGLEIIEHLQDEQELKHTMIREGVEFDQIYISTPKYTWAGGLDSWEDNYLGHLRTYTPKEFIKYFYESFPGYQPTYYEHHCMLICGRKVGS